MSVASHPLRSLLHSPVFLLGAGSLVSGRPPRAHDVRRPGQPGPLRHPRRKAPCPQTMEAGRFAAENHSCEHAASRAGSRRVAQAGRVR